jgi:hypothetical protein
MNAPIDISLVNQSTLFADADLPALANALQIQVTRDFLPSWGVDARIYYTPSGQHPSADHWVLALLDDADVAGALGYHDVTPTGQPLGKAFVRTTQSDGSSISVTVSHELLEMLGDPSINLTAEVDDGTGSPSKFYAYEVADAVEADNLGYQIAIPTGWAGAGTSILVSDFVLPAWFESFRTAGPFAFKTPLTAPFQLAAGGYISILDLANLSSGWQQIQARTDAKAAMKSRPHQGSRRERRKLPRSQWLRSTYTPGVEAIPADSGPMPAHVPQPVQEKRMPNIHSAKIVFTAASREEAFTQIAACADYPSRADELVVEVHVGGSDTPLPVSPADQKTLDDLRTETATALQEAQGISTEPPGL